MKKLILMTLLLLLNACATEQQSQYGAESATRERARIHTELGAGYYAQRQYGIALEEFNEAIRLDANYTLAYNGLGLVQSALGEDGKAEVSFKKSIQLEPTNSESRNNYGSFLCSKGRIDESIVQFMEALKNPLYATPGLAYMNAGICSLRKNDVNSAELYLQKAIQVEPLLYQASYQLALINFNRGQYQRTRDLLQLPLTNAPSAEMLWLAIRNERFLGDRDAEASHALELRKRFPNSEQAKALAAGQ